VTALLGRRIGASALELLILSAAAAAALFWDAHTDALYGWNAVKVGYWLLFFLLTAVSAIPTQPLSYLLFRIRLQRVDGQDPSFFHRFARCFVFWIFLTSPGSLNPDLPFNHLPITPREQLLGGFAVVLALVISPAVSTIASNGQASISDLLTQTTVHPQGKEAAHRFALMSYRTRFGFSVALLTLGLSLTSILLVDWRYRISDRTNSYLRERHLFSDELAKADVTQNNQLADLIEQRPPRNIYWSPDYNAYFLGLTESFRFRVARNVLSDEHALVAVFRAWINPVLASVAPSTEWVELEFYNERSLGPATLHQRLFLLYNRLDGSVHYAPVDQRFVYGKTSMRLEERLKRHTSPDSTITYFERHVYKDIAIGISIANSGWAFPSLNLIAQRPTTQTHFVGGP